MLSFEFTLPNCMNYCFCLSSLLTVFPPTGWFSWRDIHPVEKQTLASFFNGKSERRTPEIYLGIRNFIMKKFHANPQVHLESKDLSELSNGEMDARLEVLEFLSHWGLVNFHPFPPAGQEGSKPVESKSNADTEDKTSLIEKLFQFETVQSYLVPVPNEAEVSAPAQVSSLLSEPNLAEDLITAAESSVEYHCNSCSVDCSRKRYHCRTQVRCFCFIAPTKRIASLYSALSFRPWKDFESSN